MSKSQEKGERTARGDFGRDQLAREAMHLAAEHFFALLRFNVHSPESVALGRARRMDTQASTGPWLPDGLYLREVGPRTELWLVEMQSRARRHNPDRAGGMLCAAFEQLFGEGRSHADGLRVHLVEVRTEQTARTGWQTYGDADDEASEESIQPAPEACFFVSNRLLVAGEWTECLEVDPAAWPLWAFGRHVGPDAILGRMAALGQDVRYFGWISGLLRMIGRVRFPLDERFDDAQKQEVEDMPEAVAELVEDGRVTEAESDELLRVYLAQLEEQRRQLREEGREEGRKEGRKEGREEGRKEGREEGRRQAREELMSVAAAVAPESIEALEVIEDIGELGDAVRDIVAGIRR
ncbi:MAG: hypothetical protein EA398_15210 [Deltaproteobacteria bacterium]|nr:MAG: hypothetical protein EA398_15210 [Deltaproteobacteria bacterium]